MRFREPHVQRHQPRLGAESNQREAERDRRAVGAQMRGAHGVEGEMPAAALQDAETQEYGDRAEMGHHQIQKAGLADLR